MEELCLLSRLYSVLILLHRNMLSLLPLFAILADIPFAFSDATPLVIPWNTTHSYGPDGPWPVITVQVGSADPTGSPPLSTVDLHPGGMWESMILRRLFCDDNGTTSVDGSSKCLAEKAGLYNLSLSKTVLQDFTDEVGLIWQWGSQAAETIHGSAVNVLDTMVIPALQGTLAVSNSTISAVRAWQIELPDGTNYSAQVGTLSLGAPAAGIQPFSTTVTGQTGPGFAYSQGTVASNSWGLHYGSASLDQEGSLVFGGYDQSRALGDVGAFDFDSGAAMMVNLLDVQIGVERGSSPFREGSYNGLLKLNASLNGVQPTIINPILPYLFMSPETCAAVAENLPVMLNSQVGLYIWNTTDPQYQRIIKSPAYLAFIFEHADVGNLTIKVPFQLLNLTLEAPIVTTSQQYFPCRPFHASDSSGAYFLGKAFLQAAFIGMNWQKEKFFLAQAPGPGVGASNIKSIFPNDITIATDPIDNFAVSWTRDWTVLSDIDNNRSSITLHTGNTNGPKGTAVANSRNLTARPATTTNGQKGASDTGNSQKLSSRHEAGIAVGSVVGALAVAGAALLFYLRGRRIAEPPEKKNTYQRQGIRVYEKDGRVRVLELGEGLPHEADADNRIGRRIAEPPEKKNTYQRQGIQVYEKDGRAPVLELGEGLPHEADADNGIHELDVGLGK